MARSLRLVALCVFVIVPVLVAGCVARPAPPKAVPPNPPAGGTSTPTVPSFEKYIPLMGLSKEQVSSTLSDKPTPVDEGGQEFPKTGIRVWFDNKGLVNQIWIKDPNLDFKGARVGGNIADFIKGFGTPILRDTASAYANFKHKDLVLHVVYDPKTEKAIAAYLLKEWK